MNHSPLQRSPKSSLRIEIAPKTMLIAVLIAFGCTLLVQVFPVLLVAVVALFLAGTLNPGVTWLERHGVSRGWGIAVVFSALVLLVAALALLTVPSLVDQVRAFGEREPELRGRVADLLSRAKVTSKLADTVRDVHYDKLAEGAAGKAFAVSRRALEAIGYAVSALFLSLYVMIDRDRLRGGLFAVVPRSHHIRLARVLLNLEVIVGGYIRGQALTSALLAIFTFVLLTVFKIQGALALAVFAGMADVLPYIGVFLSVGPAAAAAAEKGPAVLIAVVAIMLAYQEFESRFLVPRIYGRALKLPSSMVLLALLVGGGLLGILGALLALPVAAALRMVVQELRIDLPGEDIDDTDVRNRDEVSEVEYERRVNGVPAEQAAAIAVKMSEARRDEELSSEKPPMSFVKP
jgi:predicted PurR-regulated permease PerM